MQPATTLTGFDAPLPLIDLDQITTIVADTYDYIASTYDEKQFGPVGEPLEAFVRLLKKQQKQHILNIGCNVGWEASFLIARGFTVTGIDPSTERLQKSSDRAPQGKFRNMQIHDLQFPPEQTFDAIWSTRTLIQIPQALVIDLLASWKRVLKPGGILGIAGDIGDRNGWEKTEDGRPMFYHYFAEGELEKALEAAGYQVLDKHERNAGEAPNFFVFAQRSDTSLDKATYLQQVHHDKDGKQGTVKPEDLEQAIALFLRAGSLTPREQLNLCLLYDRLATLHRADENQYKLTAQKLKLHLQTPETLSVEDFDLWFTMGQLHPKLSRLPQAVSCLELAHRLRPDHFATLVLLCYGYQGLKDLDKAIATAHEAEQLAEQNRVSEQERANLYHALGHFYVSRSRHASSSETSVADREKGDHYMQRACSMDINYLGCLASLYNETKRYPETIMLFDDSSSSEKVRAHEELLNELYFYQAEAYIGTDRYDLALANLDQVERYARATRNWDALAHVKLYQVRVGVKRKDVRDLSLDEIRSYLSDLYGHEPSLYDAESFRRDRENLISILNAFYLINPCLNDQEPPGDFDERVAGAIHYMEKIHERERWDLNLLVLADNVSALPGVLLATKYTPHWFPFDEVETDSAEQEMDRCRVWAVLALTGDVQASAMANLTFCIGRFFHREGYAIYIYDPKRALPEIIRKSLHEFFVDDIEEITQFTHINMLYDKAREYLNDTRSSLGLLSPLGAPVEDIDLLPIEGEDV